MYSFIIFDFLLFILFWILPVFISLSRSSILRLFAASNILWAICTSTRSPFWRAFFSLSLASFKNLSDAFFYFELLPYHFSIAVQDQKYLFLSSKRLLVLLVFSQLLLFLVLFLFFVDSICFCSSRYNRYFWWAFLAEHIKSWSLCLLPPSALM